MSENTDDLGLTTLKYGLAGLVVTAVGAVLVALINGYFNLTAKREEVTSREREKRLELEAKERASSQPVSQPVPSATVTINFPGYIDAFLFEAIGEAQMHEMKDQVVAGDIQFAKQLQAKNLS